MALKEKEPKVYDIYAKGTPTARAQANMPDIVTPTIEAGKNFFDSTQRLSGAMGGNLIQAGLNRLSVDRDRQQQAIDPVGYADKKRRSQLGTVPAHTAVVNEPSVANGQGPTLGAPATVMPRDKTADQPLAIETTGAIPQQAGATPMKAGSGWIRNNATGDVATMAGGGNPVLMDKLGKPITAPTTSMRTDAGRRPALGQPGQFDYGSNYGTGSEDPNDAAVQSARATQREQFLGRQGYVKAPQAGELLTRENSPGMKEAERIAYNREILQGKNQLANTALSNQGVAEERAVTTEAGRLTLGNAKKVADLQESYLNEKDPAKKKALEREFLTLTGKAQPKYQIAVQESVDPVTQMPVKRSFAVNPDNPAESFEIGGGGQQIPSAPQNPKDRVNGQIYASPGGQKGKWDAEKGKWIPVQ